MAEFVDVMEKAKNICIKYDSCTACCLNTVCCVRVKRTDGYKEFEAKVMSYEDIDWSKVPVDTKILVKNLINDGWHRRYFASYKNGRVYAFEYGNTSWSTTESEYWKYAKLYEEGEEQ